MKTDYLDIKLSLSNSKYGYILISEVFINHNKVKNYVDISGFFQDSHLMTVDNFNFYLSSDKEYEQYNKSIKRFNGIFSSVYLDSCSCGVPDCIGISNGVRVYKKKNNYVYVALKKDGYKNGILETNKFNLCFSKENIYQQRKNILNFISENKDLLSKNDYNEDYLFLIENYS